jgi:CRP/FNR family transcriptional regulator
VPLLADVPDDRLRTLWAAAPSRRLPAGQTLRHAGDPATHLLILLDGRIAAATTTPTGRAVRHGEWAAPCALDKVAVIDGGGHTATLTALVPCTVRALPRDRFLALVDDAPAVRGHVLRVLATAARRGQDRFAAAATLPAAARIAAWLLDQATATASTTIPLPGGSQQALADLLGITRVTVSRTLAHLRHTGLITTDRHTHTIHIHAPELLELHATPG